MKTILYILGYGRSGSSILSWLLNSHPNVISVGELYRLPEALNQGPIPKYCSCGSLLETCYFWKGTFKGIEQLNLNSLSFDDWNLYLFNQFFSNNSKITTIVDSSCNIKRLNELRSSQLIKNYSLKVILLTRDSRGVIYSVSKRGYKQGTWKQSLLRAIFSWLIRNMQYIHIFKNFNPNNIIHIKYEDLVTDHNIVLKSIYDFINEDHKPTYNEWKKVPPHTFAGNTRIRGSKSDNIASDDKWKNGFSKYELFLINCLTGRLNRKLLEGLNK